MIKSAAAEYISRDLCFDRLSTNEWEAGLIKSVITVNRETGRAQFEAGTA
jgi:uncharacterized protein YbcV (DUF1398 family)